jgi:hypothetical protein
MSFPFHAVANGNGKIWYTNQMIFAFCNLTGGSRILVFLNSYASIFALCAGDSMFMMQLQERGRRHWNKQHMKLRKAPKVSYANMLNLHCSNISNFQLSKGKRDEQMLMQIALQAPKEYDILAVPLAKKGHSRHSRETKACL